MKQEKYIQAIRESGISYKSLAKFSGLPYIRVWRIMNGVYAARPSEVVSLQEGIASLFAILNKKGN
jgi:hypothetical protein